MTGTSPLIRGAALVDEVGIRSLGGTRASWAELGSDPTDTRVRFPKIFSRAFPGFRRLDTLSRILILAVEALDLDSHLPSELRRDVGLVFGSATGCLGADRRFAASLLRPQGIEPAVFPYTLPSTCLGEIAIRHQLCGPTLHVSVEPGDEGMALRAAAGLLDPGPAPAILVLLGDWCAERRRVAAILLEPGALEPEAMSFAALRDDPWQVLTAGIGA